jgi:acyl dehydratase
MGPTAVRFDFARAPSVLRYFPRAVVARRAAVVPTGETVPRLEGAIARVAVEPGHLARYRAVCGFAADGQFPATYPHVLAMPLHLALMTHPAFVVRLMGLVHVANEIEWRRPLPEGNAYGLRCWLEGHRETDRGQEFDLHTELSDGNGVAWSERCTLLARRRAEGSQSARAARALLRAPKPPAGAAASEVLFDADHATARRYGRLSGDLNPIHLADFSARWFGFDQAVAHGMWSMARSLAALGPELTRAPGCVPVEFRMPLFLPSSVRLEHWSEAGGGHFVLRGAATGRPHLVGRVERS